MNMNDIVIKTINEIDYYKGEHAIPGIKFHTAGKELGVSAWGMNVIEMEAGCMDYPEHDHLKDKQEEVYVILKGSATLVTPEGERPMQEGAMVRIAPNLKRKFIPGDQGVVLLALGGTPGEAYPSAT
jgi:uncharacterized cupin superfamily protein